MMNHYLSNVDYMITINFDEGDADDDDGDDDDGGDDDDDNDDDSYDDDGDDEVCQMKWANENQWVVDITSSLWYHQGSLLFE